MTDIEVHEATAVIDNGKFGSRSIRFETGRLARQAAGSVVAYLDDETMLLSATTASKHPKEHFDFFPLTVDVEERMYAAGRIPGSFFRREGRPSTDAILTCRLIDRPLRPSFVDGLRNEIQVVITVMSLNPADLYDVVAINAASASTQLAGLPFSGPIGGVRVALIEGQWVAFPTHEQLEKAVFDMVVAGRVVDSGDVAIMMVEAEATENVIDLIGEGAVAPTEEVVAAGLEAAKPFIKVLCEAQAQLAQVAAKETGEYPTYPAYQAPPPYGAPPPPPPYGGAPGYGGYVAAPPQNGLAIAAMVCSLAGILTLISFPVGAILGHIALKQVRERGEQGEGFAKTGIIVGWIGTGLMVLCCGGYVVFFASLASTGAIVS